MKKVFKAILKYVKENILYLLFLVAIVLIFTYKLPYTVDYPGGIINIEPRLRGDIIKSKGSFNLTYVSNVPGYISNLILAKILPDWDIVKNEEVIIDGETMEIYEARSRIDLYSSISAAKYVAYNKANIELNIDKQYDMIYYVAEKANTSLEVGDQLLSYDGNDYNTGEKLTEYISSKELGDKIVFKVINKKGKEETREATIIDDEGVKRIGVIVQTYYSYNNNPNIEYLYDPQEYGPSGGLMMSLAIYNALTEKDITKGLKISGTGTINHDGTVGAIGGVKYKLLGAINKKCDAFIIPADNYEEAISVAKKHNSDIKIIKAESFDQVIDEINKL